MNYSLGDIWVDLNNMTQARTSRGFTIVELLIVIVIIAILAAITVVAYNGITGRTRTASAKATASTVLKKAHAYNAEKGSYPAISTDLTTGAQISSTTYYVPSTTATFVAAMGTTAPSSPSSLTFYKCGTGSTTAMPTGAATNITTVTGVRLDYFDFGASTTASVTAGVVDGGMVGTYNVGCIVNN
jgi:prepilin-type N-terminal cleavage/methylation domain-containing protein